MCINNNTVLYVPRLLRTVRQNMMKPNQIDAAAWEHKITPLLKAQSHLFLTFLYNRTFATTSSI